MATNNKIFVQIDNEVIELIGSDKDSFIADQERRMQEALLLESEQNIKIQLRESAIRQLAESANLSEEQIEALLG